MGRSSSHNMVSARKRELCEVRVFRERERERDAQRESVLLSEVLVFISPCEFDMPRTLLYVCLTKLACM